MTYDVVIANGLYFDGTGAPGQPRDIGLQNGRVACVSATPIPASAGINRVDATGRWVMPGFVDIHTHYDAELIAAPALTESLRHGVTTVTVGSCSISAILSDADDCSDLFTRVEAVPRAQVLPLLRATKTWTTPSEYVDFLRRHPLGPNVCSFIGHSDLRVRAMGLARAVDKHARPTEAELRDMEHWLAAALDAGMLGMSTMTNRWDKLDGDRFRSHPLPSTYATWSEYRRLHKLLRRRHRILQSAPNIETKVNALLFMLETAGFGMREPLRTTLITLADAKSSPGLHAVLGTITRFVNRRLGGDMRWQTLPVPFELYADGVDLVVFEEFGAGREVLHLIDTLDRNRLMSDEAYRAKFRRDYAKRFTPRVWHRDFGDAHITACPDASLIGKSFADIARERNIHAVDAFLDLVVEYGTSVRWRTLIANHRPGVLAKMMSEPAALIGFADSGAHLRNMAFYSFPLRMLRTVVDAERSGSPIMSIERAVHRLTGELASWMGIDAGRIQQGDRADLVVVDPAGLDARLDAYHEAPIAELGGLMRMVNRSDGAVSSVIVNGRIAYDGSHFASKVGTQTGFGTFLAAGTRSVSSRAASSDRAA